MNKTPSHLISCASESGGLVRVCLTVAKTRCEAGGQRHNQGKTIGTDLNRQLRTFLSLTRRHARRRCAMLKSP
jgi:hypothetical protein